MRFPFDFEGRNSYRKIKGMVPTDNLVLQLVDSLYKEKQLDSVDTRIYETCNALTHTLTKMATLPPKNFNNATTDSIAKRRQDYQYKEILKIAMKKPVFSERKVTKPDGSQISYQDGFQLMCEFWNTRNQTMAKNIIRVAERYPNKKIVVLTGFLHRYYIISELKVHNRADFILREFY